MSDTTKAAAKFSLGQVVVTPGALDLFARARALGFDPRVLLMRHNAGDWGDLDAEDKAANDRALIDGSRILSAYEIFGIENVKVWIITDADRSSTCLLLPSEY